MVEPVLRYGVPSPNLREGYGTSVVGNIYLTWKHSYHKPGCGYETAANQGDRAMRTGKTAQKSQTNIHTRFSADAGRFLLRGVLLGPRMMQ